MLCIGPLDLGQEASSLDTPPFADQMEYRGVGGMGNGCGSQFRGEKAPYYPGVLLPPQRKIRSVCVDR